MDNTQRLELKILALKDELSNRDDRITDLRVQLTEQQQQLQDLFENNSSLQKKLAELESTGEKDEEDQEDSTD